MKTTIIIALVALALLLSACGGGDPVPVAQCNGTPKAAVVYVGAGVPPGFDSIANACVYTTDAAGLPATVDTARAAAGVPRVYMIGNGTAAPLDLMQAHPGIANITSVWLSPAGTWDMGGSLATVYAHGAQVTTTNHEGPLVSSPATAFDAAAAIADLHLEGAQ